MAYEDKVVDVTVTLGTQPISRVGFETPLFIAMHDNFAERSRSYSSTAELELDGFAVGSPAYQFATLAFSGAFAPSRVTIGRTSLEATVVDFTAEVNSEDVALNIYLGKMKKSIRAAVIEGVTTPAQIVTALSEAIAADDDLKTVLTATVKDVTKLMIKGTEPFSVGADAGNFTIFNSSTESVSTVISEIQDEDNDWYFLHTESHVAADILAAAAFAAANFKLHVYSTNDASMKAPNNVTTSIADRLKALSYDSLGMYDPRADKDFPEGGLVGAMSSNDPSYGDSLHLKVLKGVTAPVLGTSERSRIWTRNANFYRTQYGVGAFWEGKCSSGQYADVIRFSHWLKFRMEESVFSYMHQRSNMGMSMKMSDDDLPNLSTVILNDPINVGIRNGSILTGYDEENKVFYDPIITIPKRATIPTQDLANRILKDMKVDLVYNTPLHFVRIRVAANLDRITGTSASGQTSFNAGA